MSTYNMASEPGPVTPVPGMAQDMRQALEECGEREYFHVIGMAHVHPGNLWARRSDGLYELAGSAYAFPESQVRKCTTRSRYGDCSCQVTD